jgi:hypothetical protein
MKSIAQSLDFFNKSRSTLAPGEAIWFILTGLGRCGSNLLLQGLKQNPAIQMEAEYYNRSNYPDCLNIDGDVRARRYFLKSLSPGVRARGFKLFEHHAHGGKAEKVWHYLRHKPEIRIIHLSRKNTFKRLLSLEVANRSQVWRSTNKGSTANIRIDIAPEEWVSRIADDNRKTDKLRHIFQSHQVLEILYEDLVGDWDGSVILVQKFLNVRPVKLKQKLKKQEVMPLSVRCSNYLELMEYFRDTELEWMFAT